MFKIGQIVKLKSYHSRTDLITGKKIDDIGICVEALDKLTISVFFFSGSRVEDKPFRPDENSGCYMLDEDFL